MIARLRQVRLRLVDAVALAALAVLQAVMQERTGAPSPRFAPRP